MSTTPGSTLLATVRSSGVTVPVEGVVPPDGLTGAKGMNGVAGAGIPAAAPLLRCHMVLPMATPTKPAITAATVASARVLGGRRLGAGGGGQPPPAAGSGGRYGEEVLHGSVTVGSDGGGLHPPPPRGGAVRRGRSPYGGGGSADQAPACSPASGASDPYWSVMSLEPEDRGFRVLAKTRPPDPSGPGSGRRAVVRRASSGRRAATARPAGRPPGRARGARAGGRAPAGGRSSPPTDRRAGPPAAGPFRR